MNNYLVLSVLSEHRTDLVSRLANIIIDCKCMIVDSRMTRLGQAFGMIALIKGNWNTLAKLELQLERLEHSDGITISTLRSEVVQARDDVLPYAVEVITLEQPGVIFQLTDFFAAQSIQIEDLASRSYQASYTGAAMITVNMIIGIPGSTHIAALRDEFMDLCDRFNWDGVLDPVKG